MPVPSMQVWLEKATLLDSTSANNCRAKVEEESENNVQNIMRRDVEISQRPQEAKFQWEI